jgi:hypothetical protein
MFRAAAAAAAFALGVPAAQAATANSNFNVTVTLTSQCQATNSGTTTVAFGTYTAFQATALASNTVNLTFNCTRGLVPVSVLYDTTNGTAAGVGVIAGLQYTLTTGTVVVTAGTAASTTTVGTADIRSYPVSGSMPAGQAGTCATTTCTPAAVVRTLIVTY